ncbi:hypothetical protein K8R78_02750 [bacterium]|nr:hypothetical protein [bacterium]
MTSSPNSLKPLVILLIALLLLASCTEVAEDTEEAVAEELVVDAPAAVGAVRGGLPFELPKPRHSKQDVMPMFAESIENPADGELE